MTSVPTPCIQLRNIFPAPKKGSLISLGGRLITFFSSFSASKIMEQDGSMINSRNTICTGQSISGKSAKNTGISDKPAIGTCTAKIYPSAFWRLSKMRRPMRTAPTIEAKLSSSNTSDEASRATSVPFSPMAIPMFAALSAGASFTPSPVMATISLFRFRAFTNISFCSGITRANTFTSRILSHSSSSLISFNSGPEMHLS
ncbi:hypothetical protein SDC9_153765 [bioreactor metagenome]|uniref:Uncharacterized protein n=1 Tax=bioreactor metagenome TaxID=1076179 RepID=A0A645EZ95_9ZZZZ